jgi:hypothetical protein
MSDAEGHQSHSNEGKPSLTFMSSAQKVRQPNGQQQRTESEKGHVENAMQSEESQIQGFYVFTHRLPSLFLAAVLFIGFR